MKSRLVILLVAVTLAAAGITYTLMRGSAHGHSEVDLHAGHDHEGTGHEEHAEAVKIEGIKIEPAELGDAREAVNVTGKVTVPPDRLVEVSPRIASKVMMARGTVGDQVSRGQPLAVISSVELAEARAAYRQAAARLSAARKNYEREASIVKLGVTSVRPVEEARSEALASQGEISDAKSELAQAQSEVVRQESELVQCKARLERAKELYADKIVSRQDLESAEAEYRRDMASLEGARSKVTQAQARVHKAQSKYEISKQYLAREEKVRSSRVLDMRALQTARADVASAEVELKAASDRIRVLGAAPGGSGDTIVVRSPISGRVITRATNVGEMADPSRPMFVVADMSRVVVEADVYEKDLARVRKGQSAEIRVDAYPDRAFYGKVVSISDVLSSDSRTAKVRCAVPNNDRLLRGEMFAKVSLITATNGQTVLVPREAVLDDSGTKIIFTPCLDCPEDKKAGTNACGAYDKLIVKTGQLRGDRIEILSGVEPGTPIVTVGAYQIKTAMGSGKLEAGCTDH